MATIEDNIATIKAIKSDIRTAIINKGVDVADDDGFATYPDKISQIQGGGSDGAGLDFSPIGYSAELSAELNAKYNADIAYSKTLYDSWNPNNTTTSSLYYNNTKLVFAPAIDTSNVTIMNGMFNGCNSLTTLPFMETVNVTSMYRMFKDCSSLTTIPFMDTNNVTDMDSMFYGCTSLTTIPNFDTMSVTTMYGMFDGCTSLTTIPNFDTMSVTTMYGMFDGCTSLTTIPSLDTSNVTNMGSMFNGCTLLTTIPLLDCGKVTNISRFFGSSITTLTDLGGFKDLKIDWSDNYGLTKCPNLTYQSVMNVINNLYDFRNNGDTTTTKTIKFNSKSIALLSEDDIAIATNKGWNITA